MTTTPSRWRQITPDKLSSGADGHDRPDWWPTAPALLRRGLGWRRVGAHREADDDQHDEIRHQCDDADVEVLDR